MYCDRRWCREGCNIPLKNENICEWKVGRWPTSRGYYTREQWRRLTTPKPTVKEGKPPRRRKSRRRRWTGTLLSRKVEEKRSVSNRDSYECLELYSRSYGRNLMSLLTSIVRETTEYTRLAMEERDTLSDAPYNLSINPYPTVFFLTLFSLIYSTDPHCPMYQVTQIETQTLKHRWPESTNLTTWTGIWRSMPRWQLPTFQQWHELYEFVKIFTIFYFLINIFIHTLSILYISDLCRL